MTQLILRAASRPAVPSDRPADRSAPPTPTATRTALAAAGREPTDRILPTAGSEAADPPPEGSHLQPQPGGYSGGWWNPLNWRRGVMTGDPNSPDAYYQAVDVGAGEYIEKRIAPTIQTVGGVMETGAGAAMVATGVGAAPGAVLVALGVDTTVAGVRGMYEGESKRSMTAQGVTAVTGSETAGTVVDVTSSEKWGIRRTLTSAQVSSRTPVEAPGHPGPSFFSSHLWFFGPFPV